QYGRIVNENVALSHSLSAVRKDVRSLQDRKRQDQDEIRRLRDPSGAIPDIHDRLHLVRPNEVLIYVRPAPHPWDR
nr:hypothetical protein [Candidatus Eremiobacteraeota bacterium]